MKKYILILQCKENKFYILKTFKNKILGTLKKFNKGNGCRWIRKYPAIKLLYKCESTYYNDVDHITEKWMFSKGIKNVRGGSYKSALLPEQKKKLKRKINWDRKGCYRCGRLSHFSRNCKATTYVDGEDMSDIEEEYDSIPLNNGYAYSVKEVDNRPTPGMTWHSIPP